MATIFRKGALCGTLQRHTVDHVVRDKGALRWTTKQVLMLKDDNGQQLSSAQFRANATRKARDFLISSGWSVCENEES